MPVVVDTAAVPAADRFEFWAGEVSRSFQPVVSRPAAEAPFRGRMRVLDLGALKAFRVAGDPWSLRRTPRSIEDSDPGMVQLAVQLRGRSVIEQGGRRAVLSPGDLTAFDTSHPYFAGHDVPFELLLFCLPRELLGPHAARIVARTGLVLPGDVGTGRLVGPFLQSVVAAVEDGAVPERALEIADGVVDMVRALYPADALRDGEGPGALLLAAVKASIEERLGDPGLGPEQIAAANALSLRHLHRLFAGEEATVSQWVKARRLERGRRDLRDPDRAGEPIGAVAARWGFRDAGSFSRAYRAAYGRSPREERAAATRPA